MDTNRLREECPHGYPPAWRRHCRECEHEEEKAELRAEIERLTNLLERIEALDAEYRKQGKYGDLIRVMAQRRRKEYSAYANHNTWNSTDAE